MALVSAADEADDNSHALCAPCGMRASPIPPPLRHRITSYLIEGRIMKRSSKGGKLFGTNSYWGDYVYNQWMGTYKYDTPTNVGFSFMPYMKLGQVPSNVIMMMESWKPNYPLPPSTTVNTAGQKYIFYFSS